MGLKKHKISRLTDILRNRTQHRTNARQTHTRRFCLLKSKSKVRYLNQSLSIWVQWNDSAWPQLFQFREAPFRNLSTPMNGWTIWIGIWCHFFRFYHWHSIFWHLFRFFLLQWVEGREFECSHLTSFAGQHRVVNRNEANGSIECLDLFHNNSIEGGAPFATFILLSVFSILVF